MLQTGRGDRPPPLCLSSPGTLFWKRPQSQDAPRVAVVPYRNKLLQGSAYE